MHMAGDLSPSQPSTSGAQTSSARPSPRGTPRPSESALSVSGGIVQAAGPVSSPSHVWIGQTRASISHLKPGAIAEVPLEVPPPPPFFQPSLTNV